jgi:hypothetical protein
MSTAEQARIPGRTTLLEAVNTLLSNIGESPVATLESEQVVEAQMAKRTLLEIHKEAQTRGWGWNTEHGVRYQVQADRTLTVPANLVRWSLAPEIYERRFVLRGQKVYDRTTNSYTLGADVNEVVADVVVLLPWDECPESFNRYVTIRSARVFSGRLVTDETLFRFTAMDEQMAWAELERMEAENEQPNILWDGPGMFPIPTYNPGAGLMRNSVGVGIQRLGF